MEPKLIDHLFRHHSGKMVSVLTRIFGLQHLDIIEDAVKSQKNNLPDITQGTDAIAINELFLDAEIEDAQLRMIFTACHPKLDPRDRISFALKTVSGFSIKEIASALLTKEETIKKRLMRARKAIKKADIQFHIPQGKTLVERLDSVMEVLYLIFNEGFHSNSKNQLIREDLCGEALRLCQLLLKRKQTQLPECYALFALMCFHSARLPAKTSVDNEVLDLKQQDRTLWHFPLIQLGNFMMYKAVETDVFSCYHYEAAIAAEHLKADTFENTNWNTILNWYEALYNLQPMPSHVLTMAVICIQNKDFKKADSYFKQLQPEDLEQRVYLYYAAKADYYAETNDLSEALIQIDLALKTVTNTLEKAYLLKKQSAWLLKL